MSSHTSTLTSRSSHDALDLVSASASTISSASQILTNIFNNIPSLSPSDRARFVLYGCGPTKPTAISCVHQAFSAQAAKYPQAVAVEHLGDSITFKDLDAISTSLAVTLRAKGIRPGTRVVLLFRRGIYMVVAILAILKAGASYIPLDGSIVTDIALSSILADSGAKLVLCLPEYAQRVSAPFETLSLETLPIASSTDTLVDLSSPKDEAYVIYTSGTTGRPKGVSVTHSNVTNLLCHAPGNVGMKPGERVSQLLNIAFDMCAWEVLGSLMNGCTLCIRGTSKDQWRAVLRTVNVVIATPSILQTFEPSQLPHVHSIATAGEPCPQRLADKWASILNYYNSCGPTEITIVNTVQLHRVGSPVSIGRPTPNNRVYVLDEDMMPVPIGKPGVMWASGAGISNGYVNLPELTARKYVKDPFACDGSIMFNTGDLGRWTEEGSLQHLGRVDDQVKIKGFRVELDGVSSAMQATPGVKEAVAILIDQELVGFVCPHDVDVDEVRKTTSAVLPYYAVPSRLIPVSVMPMTSNGKVDKASLKGLAALDKESKPSKRKPNEGAPETDLQAPISDSKSKPSSMFLRAAASQWISLASMRRVAVRLVTIFSLLFAH